MDGDTAPLDQLTGDDLTAATWGINTLRRLSGGEHVETREEYLAMAVPGLSKLGTADAICKRAMWVADIKTGQVRNYRQQLAAYALACMEDHFAESWTAHVVYVDQQLVRSYDFPGNAHFYILGRVVAIEHERYVIDQYARVTDSTITEMSGKVYAPVNGLQGFAGVTMGVEVLSELLYAD